TSPHAAPAPSLSLGRSTSVSSGQACRILQYRRSATLPKLVRGAPEQDPTVPCHCSRKMLRAYAAHARDPFPCLQEVALRVGAWAAPQQRRHFVRAFKHPASPLAHHKSTGHNASIV